MFFLKSVGKGYNSRTNFPKNKKILIMLFIKLITLSLASKPMFGALLVH